MSAEPRSPLPTRARPSLVKDVKGLRQVAGNLNKNRGELDRAMQVLPIKLAKIGRTAINGSFFNFYLCQFQGNIIVPGLAKPITVPYGTDGVFKDARCHLS